MWEPHDLFDALASSKGVLGAVERKQKAAVEGFSCSVRSPNSLFENRH